MAIEIEDGTGIVGANSYASVLDADTYYADRNIVDWAGAGATDTVKEGFLIEAGDFLNAFFKPTSDPLVVGQGMAFPTLDDGLPADVIKAQLILAKERVNGPLATTFGSPQVTYERKLMQGVGEKELHYASGNRDAFGNVGSLVQALMEPYSTRGSSVQQARLLYTPS